MDLCVLIPGFFRWLTYILAIFVFSGCVLHAPASAPLLDISGDKFSVNGHPTFLLGVSYFDVLGFKQSDLDELAARGFNLIRVWLDWGVWKDRTRSCFDESGNFIRASTVLDLVRAAAARGIVVDVTVLNSASTFTNSAAVERAIRSAVKVLKNEPNVFFDLVNEHNNADHPGSWWSMSHVRLRDLMATAQRAHRRAILSVSSSSPHVLNVDETVNSASINEEIETGSQILIPHFSRTVDWNERTHERVSAVKAYLVSVGRSIPLYLQEEARRGFRGQFPSASQFLHAAVEARDAGAAGWVFHTSAGFDLSGEKTFFGNLDAEEQAIVASMAEAVFERRD